jgi:methionyl-tRNA synthetase
MATIDDFAKIEMRIGTILTAAYIDGADKLLKLSVDFGEAEPRQILSVNIMSPRHWSESSVLL